MVRSEAEGLASRTTRRPGLHTRPILRDGVASRGLLRMRWSMGVPALKPLDFLASFCQLAAFYGRGQRRERRIEFADLGLAARQGAAQGRDPRIRCGAD